MQDLINKIIAMYVRQGRKMEVIRRYLRIKYHINIDMQSMQQRLDAMKLKMGWH